MFADLVHRLGEGMEVRVFIKQEFTQGPHPEPLLIFPLNDRQITELVAVQGLKSREVDSNGVYMEG